MKRLHNDPDIRAALRDLERMGFRSIVSMHERRPEYGVDQTARLYAMRRRDITPEIAARLLFLKHEIGRV